MTPDDRRFSRRAAGYAHLDNLAETGGLYPVEPSRRFGRPMIHIINVIGVVGVFIATIAIVLLVALLLGV